MLLWDWLDYRIVIQRYQRHDMGMGGVQAV